MMVLFQEMKMGTLFIYNFLRVLTNHNKGGHMTFFLHFGEWINKTPRVTAYGLNDITKEIYHKSLVNILKKKTAPEISAKIVEYYV